MQGTRADAIPINVSTIKDNGARGFSFAGGFGTALQQTFQTRLAVGEAAGPALDILLEAFAAGNRLFAVLATGD